MWWWQSQELAGAFNFGASVPLDHFTCCAAALRGRPAKNPAVAPADMTFSNSRRSHGIPGMISSQSLARNLTTSIGLKVAFSRHHSAERFILRKQSGEWLLRCCQLEVQNRLRASVL